MQRCTKPAAMLLPAPEIDLEKWAVVACDQYTSQSDYWQKVQQLVEGIVYGCKVFVKKLQEGVKEISRHYSKVDQHWQETTVTKIISESEVPPEILARAKASEELDITDELEMQLVA